MSKHYYKEKKAQINFIFKRTGGGNNFLELNEFFFFHSPLFLAKIVNVFFVTLLT